MGYKRSNLLGALGRILLSLFFLIAGLQQIFDYDGAEALIVRMLYDLQTATAGSGAIGDVVGFLTDWTPVIVWISLANQLLWGVLILIGRWVRLASCMLILSLIFWSVLTHPFWVFDGFQREEQLLLFIQNISLVGALVQLIAYRKECAHS